MLNTEAYAGARMRVVRVSIPVLDDLFTQGHDWPHMTITAGLPDGAQFVTVQHDWQLGVVEFAYIHPSFDEVPAGAYVPEHTVTVTRHYDEMPPVRMDAEPTPGTAPTTAHVYTWEDIK